MPGPHSDPRTRFGKGKTQMDRESGKWARRMQRRASGETPSHDDIKRRRGDQS